MAKKHVIFLLLFLVMGASLVSSGHAQPGLVNFRWLGDTGLAVSGQPETSAQWETLRSWGVKATVNLRREAQDNESYLNSIGIEYYYLPVANDTDGAWNLTQQQVDAGVHWVNSRLAEGKKVLIHCYWGQNRGSTLAMIWYVHGGHTAEEAYNWVVQYPVSYPLAIQRQAVADYYDWLKGQAAGSFPTALIVVAFIASVASVSVGLVIYFKTAHAQHKNIRK
jgi:protein tyrosine phosphatase (PTP) superfamily phosphohydrolase (DUF442 family)